jgi:hypothetical protein
MFWEKPLLQVHMYKHTSKKALDKKYLVALGRLHIAESVAVVCIKLAINILHKQPAW